MLGGLNPHLALSTTRDQRMTDVPSLWASEQAAALELVGAAQLIARCTVGVASKFRELCAWDRATITARAAIGSARKRGDRCIGISLEQRARPAWVLV